MTTHLTSPSSSISVRDLALAGVLGQLSFEAYAWLISPALFGLTLEPSNLVKALTAMSTGIALPYVGAFVLHFLIGSAFVLMVWAGHRFLGLKLLLSGVLSGLALWFVAQGILAPVVGRSFMMDFGPYTQSSFLGHVGMTSVMAFVLRMRVTRQAHLVAA